MAKFAFLCVPSTGHINPMVALANELVRRGHSATFLHHSDFAPLIARPNLDFRPVGQTSAPAGSFGGILRDIDRVRGLRGLRSLIREFARGTAMLCEELPTALQALSTDVIVSDWVEPAGGLVARRMGLPHVSVAAALPLNWEPGVPPPFVGWSYGETRWHRYRNIAVQYGAERLQRPLHEVIRSYSQRWRLGASWRIDQYASGYAQIAQITPGLDYPRKSLTGCFHYCGPLREPAKGDRSVKSGPRGSRRAFASLGSLQGHRIDVFERIADACAACGLDLTIAHGGRLSPHQVKRLSRRADVYDFVSYERVFRDCDVAIMHGGMNGVLDALAQGVPVVVIPLAFEQPAIAARVRRAGVGLVCPPHGSRRRLARTILEVLSNPSYAAAAGTLRDEIRAAGGSIRAADIAEQVATTGRPCLNADGLAASRLAGRHL